MLSFVIAWIVTHWVVAQAPVPAPPDFSGYGQLAGFLVVIGGFLTYLKGRDSADRAEREAERIERAKSHDQCEATITKIVDRHAVAMAEARAHVTDMIERLSKPGKN